MHSSRVVMESLDLAEYVSLLESGNYDAVAELFLASAQRLQSIGADFLVLCSNTGNLVAPLDFLDLIMMAIYVSLNHNEYIST
jgi:aspartate racemase